MLGVLQGHAFEAPREEGDLDGDYPIRKLFSKPQRAFFAANAPEGIELDDLLVLGPVNVFKLKTSAEGAPPEARRGALELPGRDQDPRAVDEVRPCRCIRGGGGGAGIS